MVRRKAIHKKKTPPQLKTWPFELAFSLGKTTHTVARKMKTAVTAVEKNLSLAKRSFKEGARAGTRARKSRVKILPNTNEAPLSPIQKEIRSLFDISGLTDTIVEMDKISLRHSSHPVVHRLLTKIKGLSPAEQEMLSGKFLERLSHSPGFTQQMLSMTAPGNMTEEDSRKLSDAFVECISQSLGDMGVSETDQKLIQKLSDEVMKPLNDLMQFYLKPKTFSQKMKRLWKLQRIFLKTIKLIHMTKALADSAEKSNLQTPLIEKI